MLLDRRARVRAAMMVAMPLLLAGCRGGSNTAPNLSGLALQAIGAAPTDAARGGNPALGSQGDLVQNFAGGEGGPSLSDSAGGDNAGSDNAGGDTGGPVNAAASLGGVGLGDGGNGASAPGLGAGGDVVVAALPGGLDTPGPAGLGGGPLIDVDTNLDGGPLPPPNPEPGTVGLFALGAAALWRRRRKA